MFKTTPKNLQMTKLLRSIVRQFSLGFAKHGLINSKQTQFINVLKRHYGFKITQALTFEKKTYVFLAYRDYLRKYQKFVHNFNSIVGTDGSYHIRQHNLLNQKLKYFKRLRTSFTNRLALNNIMRNPHDYLQRYVDRFPMMVSTYSRIPKKIWKIVRGHKNRVVFTKRFLHMPQRISHGVKIYKLYAQAAIFRKLYGRIMSVLSEITFNIKKVIKVPHVLDKELPINELFRRIQLHEKMPETLYIDEFEMRNSDDENNAATKVKLQHAIIKDIPEYDYTKIRNIEVLNGLIIDNYENMLDVLDQ